MKNKNVDSQSKSLVAPIPHSITCKAIVTGTHNWMRVGMKRYVHLATCKPFVNAGWPRNTEREHWLIPNDLETLKIGDMLNITITKDERLSDVNATSSGKPSDPQPNLSLGEKEKEKDGE